MSQSIQLIQADWPASDTIKAFTTTRMGGVSQAAYQGLNLASHVGDHPAHVAQNRQLLKQQLVLPNEPLWLEQTHSTQVISADQSSTRCGDAVYTQQENTLCTVLTADCLPLLISNRQANCVAAVHAGWRGLLAGVIENTIDAMGQKPEDLRVWIGPAISAQAFQVGNDVRDAFMQSLASADKAFSSVDEQHWLADMVMLAKMQLSRKGVDHVYGGDHCSYQDERFFSYRRDGQTGRMASLIWFEL